MDHGLQSASSPNEPPSPDDLDDLIDQCSTNDDVDSYDE